MKKLTLLLLFIAGSFVSAVSQRPLIDHNYSYLYNPFENFFIKHNFSGTNDSLIVTVNVFFNQDLVKAENIQLEAKEMTNIHQYSVTHDLGLILPNLSKSSDNSLYYSFAVTNDQTSAIDLVFSVFPGKKKYRYPIILQKKRNYELINVKPVYVDSDEEILDPFVVANRKVRFVTNIDSPTQLHAFVYKNTFDAPVPPMIVEQNNVNKTIKIDSSFSFSSNDTISFGAEGLYLVQTDTTSSKALSFRVVSEFYPRYHRIDELYQPLVYLSTRSEFADVRDGDNHLREFEEFWMKVRRAESFAQESIRDYYRKIYEANYFFTSYKEGWRTDRGMIYVIFGPPDDVIVDGETEEWVYDTEMPGVINRFSFIKVNTIFSSNHYILLRNKKYDKVWFREIDLWREGKNRAN